MTPPTPPRLLPISHRALVLGSFQVLAVLCGLAQLWISPGADNMVAVAWVVASSSLMFQYLWHSDAMTDNPLSSLALLGFCASSQFVALLAQTADKAPYVQHLRAPELTFMVLAVVHVVAIVAHHVFRHFTPLSGASSFLARNIYQPLNVHRIPRPITLWLLSVLGIAAFTVGGGGMGDVGGKFVAAFTFLVWAPFLIPLYHDMLGDRYANMTRQLPLLIGFALMIVFIALVKNFRAMMFVGPLQLTFIFIIYRSRHRQLVSLKFIQRVVLLGLLMALAAPVLSDLMVAMQMARADRDKASPTEMLKNTWEILLDKPRMELYKRSGMATTELELYDERYLSNPMLNRFSETKFHDNMLFVGQSFTDEDRNALVRNQLDKAIAIAPQNLLDALDVKLDKNDYSYSNGDFYLNQLFGIRLGGYATGSIWADLYVLTGWWFPLATFVLLTLVYILMDAFTQFGPGLFMSPAALCSTWHFYLYGIGGESVVAKLNQVTRGSLQLMVLYALCVFAAWLLLSMFKVPAFVDPKDATIR